MKTEILIYCYGAVCISMIVFNLLCIFIFKTRSTRVEKQSERFLVLINRRLSYIDRGVPLSGREHKYLEKKLQKIVNLLAFDRALEDICKRRPEDGKRYIRDISPIILFLASVYLKKEEIQSAFFLHFINKYEISRDMNFGALIGTVMQYFNKSSVYCRLNAIDALCISGQAGNVIEGLRILNAKNASVNAKLITTELRRYSGDAKKLAKAFLNEFDGFSESIKIAMIDYFSTVFADCDEFVYGLMADENENNEVRYSAIRYFSRHRFQPAIDMLKKLAYNKDAVAWIYTSQAINAICAFPDGETEGILKNALSSSNWYVRYNAAKGLEKLGVTYNGLADIINGGDRYAREMITYMAEHRNIEIGELAETEKKEAYFV